MLGVVGTYLPEIVFHSSPDYIPVSKERVWKKLDLPSEKETAEMPGHCLGIADKKSSMFRLC